MCVLTVTSPGGSLRPPAGLGWVLGSGGGGRPRCPESSGPVTDRQENISGAGVKAVTLGKVRVKCVLSECEFKQTGSGEDQMSPRGGPAGTQGEGPGEERGRRAYTREKATPVTGTGTVPDGSRTRLEIFVCRFTELQREEVRHLGLKAWVRGLHVNDSEHIEAQKPRHLPVIPTFSLLSLRYCSNVCDW